MMLSFTCSNNHESQELESMWMANLWGEGGLNRRVLLVLAVSSLVEDECGRAIEGVNCDSLGSEAFLRAIDHFATDGLLMLLEVDEMDTCNCDE